MSLVVQPLAGAPPAPGRLARLARPCRIARHGASRRAQSATGSRRACAPGRCRQACRQGSGRHRRHRDAPRGTCEGRAGRGDLDQRREARRDQLERPRHPLPVVAHAEPPDRIARSAALSRASISAASATPTSIPMPRSRFRWSMTTSRSKTRCSSPSRCSTSSRSKCCAGRRAPVRPQHARRRGQARFGQADRRQGRRLCQRELGHVQHRQCRSRAQPAARRRFRLPRLGPPPAPRQLGDQHAATGVADKKLEGYRDVAGRLQLGYSSGNFNALVNFHVRDLDGTPRVFRAGLFQPGSNDFIAGFDPSKVALDGYTSQSMTQWGTNLRLDYRLRRRSARSIRSPRYEKAKVETPAISTAATPTFIPGCARPEQRAASRPIPAASPGRRNSARNCASSATT